MKNNSDHLAVHLDKPESSFGVDALRKLRAKLDKHCTVSEDALMVVIIDDEMQKMRNLLDAYLADLEKAKQNSAGLVIEALIASLPKTADGIPIVPGMTVYCIAGRHVDEREVIGPYGKLALLTSEPARHGAGPGQCHRLANTVYSTFDAAKSGINPDSPQAK